MTEIRDQPQNERLHPPPQPSGSRRQREPMYRVWSPEGREELHTLSNARDLVRLDGWHARKPGEAELAPIADEPASPQQAASKQHSSRGVVEKQAVSRLQPLREEAAALGVLVDMRWGVRRLTDEISAKKAEIDQAAACHRID